MHIRTTDEIDALRTIEPLSNKQKIAILNHHSVDTRINGAEQLEAKDIYWTRSGIKTFTWIDVTSWTVDQLFDWLGY